MDQRRLVEQAREGDHDAFAVLLGTCVARLGGVARLILRHTGVVTGLPWHGDGAPTWQPLFGR